MAALGRNTSPKKSELKGLRAIVGQITTCQAVKHSGVVYLSQWWRESEVFDSEQTGSHW